MGCSNPHPHCQASCLLPSLHMFACNLKPHFGDTGFPQISAHPKGQNVKQVSLQISAPNPSLTFFIIFLNSWHTRKNLFLWPLYL